MAGDEFVTAAVVVVNNVSFDNACKSGFCLELSIDSHSDQHIWFC